MKNNYKKIARNEHDAALQRVMINLLATTLLVQQFSDNPYQQQASQPASEAVYGI